MQVTRLQLPIADLGIIAQLKGAARREALKEGPNGMQDYQVVVVVWERL